MDTKDLGGLQRSASVVFIGMSDKLLFGFSNSWLLAFNFLQEPIHQLLVFARLECSLNSTLPVTSTLESRLLLPTSELSAERVWRPTPSSTCDPKKVEPSLAFIAGNSEPRKCPFQKKAAHMDVHSGDQTPGHGNGPILPCEDPPPKLVGMHMNCISDLRSPAPSEDSDGMSPHFSATQTIIRRTEPARAEHEDQNE